MRTLTATQLEALQSRTYQEFVRVDVQNADGTWIDYSVAGGLDWLLDWSVSFNVDQACWDIRVTLQRENGALSLAPLRTDSALNVDDLGAYAPAIDSGRGIRVYCAVLLTGPPSASDWVLLCPEGEIDEVDAASEDVKIAARSRLGARAQDSIIEDPTTYGSEVGEAIEDVMQLILDDWHPSTPTLSVPASPGFNITPTPYRGIPVMEAELGLAALIGYYMREQWDNVSEAFELTFGEPDRSPASTAYDFTDDDYFDVEQLKIHRSRVRNVIRVYYYGLSGIQDFVEVSDAASIAKYGRRPYHIVEPRDSPIDTSTEATALANAALSDLKDPTMDKKVRMRFWWPAMLDDFYGFLANGVHYDADQELAVTGVEHRGNRDGTIDTFLFVTGQPVAFGAYWFKRRRVRASPRPQRDTRILSVEPRFGTGGQLSLTVTVGLEVGSVKAVAEAGSDPTSAEIDAATEVVVDGDGQATITGLGSFTAAQVAHVAVRAFREADASDAGYQIHRLRAQPTTGQAGNTDNVDDGPANEVARNVQRGTVMGPDADGEVAVTFPVPYNAPPIVTIGEVRVKSFDAGLGTGSDQTLVLEATDISASGFLLRAKLVGGSPTLVADGDDFAAGSGLNAVNDSVECNLASLPADDGPGGATCGAFGEAFTIHYSFYLQVGSGPGDSFFRGTVVLAFESNDGGGWMERATQSHQVDASGGATADLTLTHATKVINVSELWQNDDIRIRIKSITESGDGSIISLDVHGFNLATDADATEGVTWQEETVAASEASAIDDASHFVKWEAKAAA